MQRIFLVGGTNTFIPHGYAPRAVQRLVGWLEFNVPFQHKRGYIRDEGQSNLGRRLDEDVEEGRLAMRRSVDEVAVMTAVGDGKQEVVGHGLVDGVALIFHVSGVDV